MATAEGSGRPLSLYFSFNLFFRGGTTRRCSVDARIGMYIEGKIYTESNVYFRISLSVLT